ncbi:MAG TPA: hypothetical protein VFF84_00290 [Sphingobium sp.]|nr:hypothetical protein [Sphingobium sp.]
MTIQPGLDDRRNAAFAWSRFRKMLRAMAAASLAFSFAMAALVWWLSGPLPIVFVIMTVVGVWATIMMAALLMGLMFLSSGTGHDEQVEDRVSKDVLGEDD